MKKTLLFGVISLVATSVVAYGEGETGRGGPAPAHPAPVHSGPAPGSHTPAPPSAPRPSNPTTHRPQLPPTQPRPEPVKPDPVRPEPVKPDPVRPDPVKPGPITPKPGDPRPVGPAPVGPKPGDPQPGRPEPGRPEPGRPEPGKPTPGRPEPVGPARPVWGKDPRSTKEINGSTWTQHVDPRNPGWGDDHWRRPAPNFWIERPFWPQEWWALDGGYGWCAEAHPPRGYQWASTITCQSVYEVPAGYPVIGSLLPGDVYTAESLYGTIDGEWNDCGTWQSQAPSDTLGNALDQCTDDVAAQIAALGLTMPDGSAIDPSAYCSPAPAASAGPTGDIDGCFLGYEGTND